MCAECLEEKHAGVIYGLHLGDFQFRYIGKSISHRKRYYRHIREAMQGGGYAVQDWIRKHGAENIQMTIIETFTEEDIDQLDEREIFHIAQARFLYTEKNLNLTDGGGGALGVVVSDETRAKISALHTGRKRSEATLLRMSLSQTGRTLTPEHRAKIGAAHKGKTASLETRQKIGASNIGRPPNSGQHARWHRDRNIIKTDCTYCMEGGNK